MKANYRQIAGPDGLLAKRLPFEGNTMRAGKLEGMVTSGDFYTGYGQLCLHPEVREMLKGKTLSYIVFSYNTPIAWVEEDGTVVVPDVKYSVTTSRQQGYCQAWLLGGEVMETYEVREITKVMMDPPVDIFYKMQIKSGEGSTKWMNLSWREVEAIRNALADLNDRD